MKELKRHLQLWEIKCLEYENTGIDGILELEQKQQITRHLDSCQACKVRFGFAKPEQSEKPVSKETPLKSSFPNILPISPEISNMNMEESVKYLREMLNKLPGLNRLTSISNDNEKTKKVEEKLKEYSEQPAPGVFILKLSDTSTLMKFVKEMYEIMYPENIK